MHWLDDLRLAVRGLRRAPRFAALALMVLAVGIGGSTAMFSAIKSLLLDAVPYPSAGQLVMVSDFGPDGASTPLAFGSFRELATRAQTLEQAAVLRGWEPSLTGAGEPRRLLGGRVSAAYFDTLGTPPVLGPGFSADQDHPSGVREVVLGHALWAEYFGADPGVIGRDIALDEQAFRVVGVMAPTFRDVIAPSAELWGLLQYDPALPAAGREWGKHLRMIGRLPAGVDLGALVEEVRRIGADPIPAFARPPHADLQNGARIEFLQAALTRSIRPGLLAGSAAVALLLIIACVNVAHLLLVRGTQRRQEIAARSALGATPWRLVRQQMVEVLVLALAGAGLGLGLAQWALYSLQRLAEARGYAVVFGEVDSAALLFATAIATGVGLLVGLVPAWQAIRRGPSTGRALRAHRGIGRQRAVRGTMVIAEVALAAVLLVCAGLLLGSLQRLFSVDSGMQARDVLTLQVHVSGAGYPTREAVDAYYLRVLDAVRSVPGVRSAALTNQMPMTDDRSEFGARFETLAGEPVGQGYNVLRYAVSADYFSTLGIPIQLGRALDARDDAAAPKSVVISRSLAQRRFGDASPIGRRMQIGPEEAGWYTIVGVAGDVRHASLAATETDAVYASSAQWHFADAVRTVTVSTRADPASLAASLREAIWSVDPDRPVTRVATLNTLIERTAGERQLAAMVFSAFGAAALLLACMGLYGAFSVHVAERTGEFGLRMALGARAAVIARSLLGHALGLIAAGLVIGLVLAGGATAGLRSLLFDLSATDPATYLLAALTLGGVGLLACLAPLRRAMSIEPAEALRSE